MHRKYSKKCFETYWVKCLRLKWMRVWDMANMKKQRRNRKSSNSLFSIFNLLISSSCSRYDVIGVFLGLPLHFCSIFSCMNFFWFWLCLYNRFLICFLPIPYISPILCVSFLLILRLILLLLCVLSSCTFLAFKNLLLYFFYPTTRGLFSQCPFFRVLFIWQSLKFNY